MGYEWRFCKECHQRIFSDEVLGDTIQEVEGELYCIDCAVELQTTLKTERENLIMNKIIIFKQPNHLCRPCGTLSAILEEDLEVQADIVVDVTTGQAKGADGATLEVDGLELASKYGVMATPVTLLVDGDGAVIQDVRGLPQRDVLVNMFGQRG